MVALPRARAFLGVQGGQSNDIDCWRIRRARDWRSFVALPVSLLFLLRLSLGSIPGAPIWPGSGSVYASLPLPVRFISVGAWSALLVRLHFLLGP